MWIIYAFVLILVITSIRFAGFHEDYISPLRCNAIKGVFICLVFVRHIRDYVAALELPVSTLDRITLIIDGNLGQLIVALFLFYSGYGLMESYKKKGQAYIKQIPQKRILSTLLNFDLAVIVFFVVSLLLGKHYSLGRLGLSLIAWESVGNSSWYIFVILLCYLLYYLAFVFPKNNNPKLSIGLLVLSLIVIGFVLSLVKNEWWYNTLLCFASGVMYSAYLKGKEQKLLKHYWLIMACISLILVGLLLFEHDFYCIKYNIFSSLFAFWVVLITMKVQIKSEVLNWFGKNLFPLYIYQRLPMMVFSYSGIDIHWGNSVIFTVTVFTMTVGLAYLYKYADVSSFLVKKNN